VTASEVAAAARQVAGAKFICWPSSIRDYQQTASFTGRRECSLCRLCCVHLCDRRIGLSTGVFEITPSMQPGVPSREAAPDNADYDNYQRL
jgi:hypothetical protein